LVITETVYRKIKICQEEFISFDGDKYEGAFKDGNFWNGTRYEIDGNIFGKWVNVKLKVK
jgi:hypothetical protein|tara:strand:- start:182 stop:361 length:180 start_codon:yes stop_codon:yes gene_type:complete